MAAYSFHEPYLRAIFGFIGVTDVVVVYADSQNMGDEAKEAGLSSAKAMFADLAKT